jgi:tryptophan-rich sensory protein
MPPEYIWILCIFAFGLSGGAMLFFARPFERFGQKRPEWSFTRPHSATFYRVMGAIWLLIALVMAVPAILIWHANSS